MVVYVTKILSDCDKTVFIHVYICAVSTTRFIILDFVIVIYIVRYKLQCLRKKLSKPNKITKSLLMIGLKLLKNGRHWIFPPFNLLNTTIHILKFVSARWRLPIPPFENGGFDLKVKILLPLKSELWPVVILTVVMMNKIFGGKDVSVSWFECLELRETADAGIGVFATQDIASLGKDWKRWAHELAVCDFRGTSVTIKRANQARYDMEYCLAPTGNTGMCVDARNFPEASFGRYINWSVYVKNANCAVKKYGKYIN